MLPAYAGMILESEGLAYGEDGAPRVCGDDPALLASEMQVTRCSPRMRG